MSFIQDFLVPLGADAFLKAFQDNRPFLIPGNAAKIETLFGGPMGKTELLRQTSFTARDGLSWAHPDGHPYTWDEIVPMLDGLLSVGILRRR